MSIISRATMPDEFYDITSGMLLVQPEPQYVYAAMWKAAMNADLSPPAALGLSMAERSITGVGAQYASIDQGRLMLAKQIMSEAIAGRVDMAGLPGHTVRLNRPKFTDSTYTEASRTITSDQTISTTGISLSSEQASLTLKRFAGPYGSSSVQPYAIDAMDAKLGVHKVSSIVGLHLKRDFDKTVDSFIKTLLDTASTTLYPNGMTTANDATTAGSFPMDFDLVNRLEENLDTNNIPFFADGYRILVATPKQVSQLKNDQQYARSATFMPEYNILMPGYVTSIGKLHVVKSNTLSVTANTSSINVHTCHAFGPGAIGAGMGMAPQVRPATDDNYGETAKVIWLAYLAFTLFDNRFVVAGKTSA